MSDDIEKLLAEVSKSTSPSSGSASSASTPARKDDRTPAKSGEGAAGGRLAFAVITALILGGAAFVVGIITPFVLSGPSMGFGAAIGAFVTALLAGPPRWFSS